MRRASRVFSISSHTAQLAARYTPGLREGLSCRFAAEPPDPVAGPPFRAASGKGRGSESSAICMAEMMYKGHQQLIAAWPQVVSACPGAQLWIVGRGDGEPLLREQVSRLSVHAAIRFFGAVSGADLARLYRTARVFAMRVRRRLWPRLRRKRPATDFRASAENTMPRKRSSCTIKTGLLIEQHPHDAALACIRLLTDDADAERLEEAGRLRYWNNFRFTHFRERLLTSMGLDC